MSSSTHIVSLPLFFLNVQSALHNKLVRLPFCLHAWQVIHMHTHKIKGERGMQSILMPSLKLKHDDV